MKTKVILTLCAVLVLGMVSMANAQTMAGSDEDKAFTKILGETAPDAKLQLLLDFEKQFPQSKVLPDIYNMAMDVYQQKKDAVKATEFGEKAIKADPDNYSALIVLSQTYARDKKSVDKAITYAQRSLDAIAKRRGQPTPPNYTDDQWKQYLDTMESTAKSTLTYAKTIKP